MFFRVTSVVSAVCLVSIWMSNTSNAQVRDFGDITVHDFSDYDSKYDSTMPAIILMEFGEASFDSELNTYLNYHKRMLILQDEGLEYADIEVPISKELRQEIRNIRAASYSISERGIIERSELGSDQILTEKFDDDIKLTKFLIPNVKKGTIIEYQFRKKMGNPFLLPDWEFHDYLPVKWSEYRMDIPIGLDYKIILKGSDTLEVYEVEKSLLSNVYNNNNGSQVYRMVKKDLPPVENLPFLINRDDYLSKVITQLREIRLPNYRSQRFFKDWDMIADELNDRGDFGKQRLNGEMKEVVEMLIEGKTTDIEKAKAIYEYVIQALEWDGKLRFLTEKGVRDTFSEKIGNSGDINHTLIEMLRYAQIKASPGLLSTRSNGSVITNFALINQFNMAVAVIETDEGAFIMDASSGKRAFTIPHPKILYRNVFVIREDDSFGWIKVNPIEKNNEQLSLKYKLTIDEEIKVDYSGKYSGEFAENARLNVDIFNQNKFWEEKLEVYEQLKVDSSSFENLLDIGNDILFSTSLTFQSDEIINKTEDLLYFNPFLFLGLDKNPFKREERDFPIEIAYPYKKQFIVFVEIPEGYEVDEIPESSLVRLPNKSGHYRFMVSQNYNMINFMAEVDLKSAFYQTDVYTQVKDMFQEMVNTQAFTVVLKKTESVQANEND